MTPTDFIKRFDLAGKTVLETGSLEGKHTAELLRAGVNVWAVDCKEENIRKSKEATNGCCDNDDLALSFVCADLETYTFPDIDACWHSGTLYHLTKPVEHLHRNLPKIKHALYLSTHYSPNNKPHWHRETQGMPKAGLSNRSLWLPKATIKDIVAQYFDLYFVVDDRVERHGNRMELVAWNMNGGRS